MRKLKNYILSLLFLLLLTVIGLWAYYSFIYSKAWYSNTKHESVRILKSANSIQELTNAVGSIGIFIPLTNNAWIAIRYRDIHGGGVYSCAVVRDSGGSWFESDRHFCGFFQGWPNNRARVEDEVEMKKADPQSFTNTIYGMDSNGMFPTYREMLAIESAKNLETARIALQKIGFKNLNE